MSENAKQIRTKMGWSQAELARRAGLNASTMCQIESGRYVPYRIQREKIAAALGLSVEQIDFD